MRHGSLFSGIGGFDLAAEWMGWENVFHCEIDKNCQKVLKRNFPDVELLEDVNKSDFKKYNGQIDIITGGEPCQPHSKSGKRKGKSDARYLWPQMLKSIADVSPSWVVNENVRGSIGNGVLDTKISDLENIGYACWPPLLIPSCAKSIHERYRVWLVAYSDKNAINNNTRKIQGETRTGKNKEQGKNGKRMRSFSGSILNEHNWKEIASKICGDTNGLSRRVVRNGMIGNSIDPQIAYEIFKTIDAQRTER